MYNNSVCFSIDTTRRFKNREEEKMACTEQDRDDETSPEEFPHVSVRVDSSCEGGGQKLERKNRQLDTESELETIHAMPPLCLSILTLMTSLLKFPSEKFLMQQLISI